MTKSQRLLNLLNILRGYRHPVSGERLAERLGISIRTLYRDIASLQAMGAEIVGEVGVGYILKPSFFLPPLMLNQIEMQALLLGARWVTQYGDVSLSKAATNALDKIYDVLPSNIKNGLNTFTLRVGPPALEELAKEDLTILREAIAKQNKVDLVYSSEEGETSSQIVWPFTIGYFTDKRVLVAWCENQKRYRHFITNRIKSLTILVERYTGSSNNLFIEWQKMHLRMHHRKTHNAR